MNQNSSGIERNQSFSTAISPKRFYRGETKQIETIPERSENPMQPEKENIDRLRYLRQQIQENSKVIDGLENKIDETKNDISKKQTSLETECLLLQQLFRDILIHKFKIKETNLICNRIKRDLKPKENKFLVAKKAKEQKIICKEVCNYYIPLPLEQNTRGAYPAYPGEDNQAKPVYPGRGRNPLKTAGAF